MTVKDFFEKEADDIIENLTNYWSVQRDGCKSYVNEPFESKEEFLNKYENSLDSPWEDVTDADTISDEEENKLFEENKKRISEMYDKIFSQRQQFLNKK